MATIAEFLATIGFKTDGASLKSALSQVAAFGTAVSAAAGGAIAGIMRIAQSEAQLADDAKNLAIPAERLEELRFVAEQSGASVDALNASLAGIKKANPGIKDTGALLDRAAKAMRGMNEQAARLYAEKMGIDPDLVPMLREDVAGLTADFKEMYAASGRDAARAAADGKALMQEFGKLKSLFELLAKAVGGAFIGKIRGDVELLRKAIIENLGKIKRIFEIFIALILRVGGAVGAFVYRVVKVISSLVGWFDKLDDGQKKLVIGIGLILAAWKLLNKGFLATPFGRLIAGLMAIIALVDDYMTWAEGGDSLIDWGPYAEAIDQVVAALKVLWGAVGAGLAKAIEPAIGVIKTIISTIADMAKGIIDVFAKLFSGDFAGALEAAKGVFLTWINGVVAIFTGLCDTIAAFFAGMWESVTAAFPDFAAWASNAANAIKNFFGQAFDWVKDKIAGLTSFLPDFVKKKLGLGGKSGASPEGGGDQGQGAPATTAPAAPSVPQGPALTPSPLAGETAVNKNTDIKVDSKTQITVNGAQSPDAVAGKVAAAQNSNAADIARHTQGAVR